MEIIIIIIVLKLISLAISNSKNTRTDTNEESYDYRCCSCGEYFNEEEVMEWLDDNDEVDDCLGYDPCCPYCGSSDVEEN